MSKAVEAARRTRQTFTKDGKPAVVAVDVAEYERPSASDVRGHPSFADVLLGMPQDNGEFSRENVHIRGLELMLDTVPLSGLRRREHDPPVLAWPERQRITELFLERDQDQYG